MAVKTNNEEKNLLALTALHEVIDPEIGLNIVDLGLVYEVEFKEEDSEIWVEMTLTTQFCPMGESIVDSSQQAMQQVFPDNKITVNLSFDPPWDQSMISEEGHHFLNF